MNLYFDVNKVNTKFEIRNDTVRKFLSLEPRDHPYLLQFTTYYCQNLSFMP